MTSKRLPHETKLLLAAWCRCEEEGKQREFWRMLKVATALRRMQDNERKGGASNRPGTESL